MQPSGKPFHGALLACCFSAIATPAAAVDLKMTPRVDMVYDSNVARSSEQIAQLRGLHRSDFRITPGIGVSLIAPLGGQEIFLNADLGRDFYARNSILNRERILASGGVHARIGRCVATPSGNFSIKQSDIADLLSIGTVKNTERYWKVGVDAQCGGPIGLVPSLGVARSWSRNSAELLKRSDFHLTEGHAGLAYMRPTFGELSLVATVQNLDYLERDVLVGAAGGYKLFSLGGRFERNIGSRLRGSVALYRTSVDQKLVHHHFTGITSNTFVDLTLKDNVKVHANWDREVSPANYGFGDYVLTSNYGVRADYGLSPRLGFVAGAGVERRKTEGETFSPPAQLESERRTFGFTRLTFKRGQRASADLEVRREVRKAVPALFDYDSTRVSLSLRLMI